MENLGWDGMGLTSGYGCRHRSKNYSMAHPLPYLAFRFVGRLGLLQ